VPDERRWFLVATCVAQAAVFDAFAYAHFGELDEHGRLIVAAVAAALIGTGGWQLTSMPSAVISWILTLSVGLSAAIAAKYWATHWYLVPLLGFYGLILLAIALTKTRGFIAQLRAQTEIERQRETVSLLLNDFEQSAADWLWEVNRAGKLRNVSKRFTQVCGLPAERLQGKPFVAFQDDSEAILPTNDLHLLLNGLTPFRNVIVPVRVDGARKWWSLSAKPLRNELGELDGWRGVGSDITAVRQAEVAERQAQEQRLIAERAKSNFIANMSHELRTPLNAIIGFSEMMQNQSLGPLGSPKYVEFADLVAKSGHHLLAVVNSVLQVARLDQPEMNLSLEHFDFDDCLKASIEQTRQTRDYKSQFFTIEPGDDFTVRADRRLLSQVIMILLSNAVKFSGEGTEVVITRRADGNDLLLEIVDFGCGIAPELMAHISTPFHAQTHSFNRRHEGIGVGLVLAQRYVQSMGGALLLTSKPGSGTQVRLRIPGAVIAGFSEAAA
jgi:PAS domain S-box-containing protein